MRIVSEILLAALNSLWQAALVAGVVWLALRLLRRGFPHSGVLPQVAFQQIAFQQINAATRYAIWWAVLAVTLALPAAPTAIAWWHARARPTIEAGPRAAVPRPNIAPPIEEQPPIVTPREERTARWPAWVLVAWAALCLYRLFQIGRSYVYLRGVKRRAIASQAALPPIARPARLLLSIDIASPMAVGFLHPAVILPESLPSELAQPEMEHVLLHEVAHIARKDDWSNLLARLLGAALALHPVAWWILRQIEREREIACDDWVVARTGSARPYAQSLARMSELRWSKKEAADGANQGEALASGIFGGGSRLGERIEMLLVRGRVFSPRASMGRVAASGIVLLGCMIAGTLAPRWIAFAQAKPSFEVASVKRNTNNGQMDVTPRRSGNRVIMHNAQLGFVFVYAYNFKHGYQYSGSLRLPDGWNWYDIEATVEGSPSDDQIRLMFQSLLEDRFKLKVHRETRELPSYELVVAKNGPKLRRAREDSRIAIDGKPLGAGRGGIFLGTDGRHLAAMGGSIDMIVTELAGELHAPVVDRTGITGSFDFDVRYVPENSPPDAEPGPSIATAIQEELGLRLEKSKGPVEVVVIDHVEKPSEN
jgi:uncharacterized protein (TIGR03435 family)